VATGTQAPIERIDLPGTIYYFCGRGCLLDFQDDPARVLAPGYQPHM
jgi:YHS domain-containing protein